MARKTAEEAAKTRSAIVDAALVVFAEKGPAAAQLDDVASRAGVTRGAVYHHFAGKDELLQVVLAERWALATAPVLAPLETEQGRVALRGFVLAYLEALDHDPTLRALLVVSRWSGMPAHVEKEGLGRKKQVFDRWLELLDKQLEAASVAKGKAARVRSESILASLLGHAVLGSLTPPKVRETAAVRADLILDGALR